jgi:hypothetical protein
MPPVNDLALLKRRRGLLTSIRLTTGAALGNAWDNFGAWTDDQQDRWARIATAILTAGQNRAIDLQIAYLQTTLRQTIPFDRAALLERAAIDVNQPFVALANALAGGIPFTEALTAGRLRAEGVGESGTQWAARAANNAAEGDERIVGWTRVLDGDPCDWCQLVSTQRYHTADSASFGHLRCGCDVEPILGTRDPGRVFNTELLAELKANAAA